MRKRTAQEASVGQFFSVEAMKMLRPDVSLKTDLEKVQEHNGSMSTVEANASRVLRFYFPYVQTAAVLLRILRSTI